MGSAVAELRKKGSADKSRKTPAKAKGSAKAKAPKGVALCGTCNHPATFHPKVTVNNRGGCLVMGCTCRRWKLKK